MKWLLIVEALAILLLLGQFMRLRRTRSLLANQLLKIMYETGGRKGVVSHLTMTQSARVLSACLGKK